MGPVDKMLTHLFYLYTKSSKKHRKLMNLYTLRGEFEMYATGVRPIKATGTRRIDYKLQAVDFLIEKFGLYCVHVNDIISTTTNSKEKATLKGKLNKLVDAKAVLC